MPVQLRTLIWNAKNGGEKNENLIRECKQEIMQAAKKSVMIFSLYQIGYLKDIDAYR
jgi:hypothetical protein